MKNHLEYEIYVRMYEVKEKYLCTDSSTCVKSVNKALSPVYTLKAAFKASNGQFMTPPVVISYSNFGVLPGITARLYWRKDSSDLMDNTVQGGLNVDNVRVIAGLKTINITSFGNKTKFGGFSSFYKINKNKSEKNMPSNFIRKINPHCPYHGHMLYKKGGFLFPELEHNQYDDRLYFGPVAGRHPYPYVQIGGDDKQAEENAVKAEYNQDTLKGRLKMRNIQIRNERDKDMWVRIFEAQDRLACTEGCVIRIIKPLSKAVKIPAKPKGLEKAPPVTVQFEGFGWLPGTVARLYWRESEAELDGKEESLRFLNLNTNRIRTGLQTQVITAKNVTTGGNSYMDHHYTCPYHHYLKRKQSAGHGYYL